MVLFGSRNKGHANIKGFTVIDILCSAFLLDDASVDAIVSDIPFGSKHGTVDGVRQLLPKLVPSLHRYAYSCIYVPKRKI